MSWIVRGTTIDRNIFSKTFGQQFPCLEVFDDQEDLLIHLLKTGALDGVLHSMLGRVLTPETFLEFLMDSPRMTCGEALNEVIEDVAREMFREGLRFDIGQDVTFNGTVLARWSEGVEE